MRHSRQMAAIVSAFCLIFDLEVAVKKKLLCFHNSWSNLEQDVLDHIIIPLASADVALAARRPHKASWGSMGYELA